MFLASPQSITPFHLDHEQNFLCHIRGPKTFYVWDHRDRDVEDADPHRLSLLDVDDGLRLVLDEWIAMPVDQEHVGRQVLRRVLAVDGAGDEAARRVVVARDSRHGFDRGTAQGAED